MTTKIPTAAGSRRVAAAAPSTSRLAADSWRFGEFELRCSERLLFRQGHPIRIGCRAFDTLRILIERRDRVVLKRDLMDAVWPGLVVEENNLQVQVNALRGLFGKEAIATVPRRGYQWTMAIDANGESVPPPADVRILQVDAGRALVGFDSTAIAAALKSLLGAVEGDTPCSEQPIVALVILGNR